MTVLVADGCGFILRGLREAAFFLIATAAYSTPIHVQTVQYNSISDPALSRS